jgi:putative CocE/NonD family hydrolase
VHSKAVVSQDIMVPMRDGVRLATDLYLPSGEGQFALLLSRTPYSKQRGQEQALRAVRRGFAVAIQDTRGRYQSEGSFRSMQDDAADGWDTLEWLAQQPWCNGRIGTYGVSYLGAVQMMLAPLRPANLVAAFSEQPSSDEFTDRTFHAGALTLHNVEGWAVNSSGEQYNLRLDGELRQRAEQELAAYRELGAKAVEVLPLEDVPWLRLIPSIWQDVLDHVEDPAFFAANDICSKLHDIAIPIYHLGGWFDPFLRNTINHYKGATSAMAQQRLILGPWTHGGMEQTEFPDGAFDHFGYAMAWHDRWLRGADALSSQEHAVIVYVMGANRWRAEDAWPLVGTQVTSYYLRGGGHLSTSAASDAESPDHYAYDPRLPVPTPPMGRVAVTELLERDDVLVYATPPLSEPVEVTGEIRATLFAASSANDTDWMLRVVDVQPDGQALQVVDGVMRARYRHSRTRPTPIVPEQVERYDIDLWATSLVFDRGHRIAAVISSSNFPKYDRHPNRFADLRKTTEADFVTARQTVYHTAEYASAIHLPIVPISEHQRWIANPMPLQSED